ncbi:MAG: hypothetical protein ACO1OB_12960 [Archangium sp.]
MKRRGATLVEALMAMVVAAVGVSGVASVLIASSKMVRRNQLHQQALTIAQRQLEGIASMGCSSDPAALCANIQALDGPQNTVWLSPDSTMRTTAPTANDTGQREFTVLVDVDPPYEGTERGSPAIDRPLFNTARGSVVNVRVTVAWREGTRVEAEALQTRMAP